MCIRERGTSFALLYPLSLSLSVSLSSFLLFPSHRPSIPRAWLIECGGVRRTRMVALNSTTLLSMGILVYSARRFGYSPLTSLVQNQVSICQPVRCVFVCPRPEVSRRGTSRGYKWLINADSGEDTEIIESRGK